MKQLMITILIAFLLSGCCGSADKKDPLKIQDKDKIWFPYKSKTNFFYETLNGLKDTLSITKIDTSMQLVGTECVAYKEYRYCKMQSTKYNVFQIDIIMDITYLELRVNYSDNVIDKYYCTSCNKISNDPYQIILTDSIVLNNIKYNNVLVLSDSTKDFSIYYNSKGVLRYVIKADSFDLKSQ